MQVANDQEPERQNLWIVGNSSRIEALLQRYPQAWQPEPPEPCANLADVQAFKLPSY
jgi:hypothetical protein